MTIHVDLEAPNGSPRVLDYDISVGETAAALGERIAADLGIEPADLPSVVELDGSETTAQEVMERGSKGERLRVKVVCIELHYETEVVTRTFPSKAPWSRVHRWGCQHFHVAHDACVQLELRDGDLTGALLNEREPIGTFDGCRVIWLIKPGAEPNGK